MRKLRNIEVELNDNRISTSWKWFNVGVHTSTTWFHFEMNISSFPGFLWKKNPVKRFTKIVLTNQKNTEQILKWSRKNSKTLKLFKSFSAIQSLKISALPNHGSRLFLQTLTMQPHSTHLPQLFWCATVLNNK